MRPALLIRVVATSTSASVSVLTRFSGVCVQRPDKQLCWRRRYTMNYPADPILERLRVGRYYEPYYLVFARPSQVLTTPQLVGTATEEPIDDSSSNGEGLVLIRHTVPHFVPLDSLLERYIPAVLGGSRPGGSSSRQRAGAGGLSLLSEFQALPGVEAFLSALHCHLQAFVSRREQATSLRQAQLPGASSAAATLDVFGSDAYDLIKVVWRIPHRGSDGAAAPGPDVDPDEASEPAAKRTKTGDNRIAQAEPDAAQTSVEILVHYADRRADRLSDPTLKVPDPSSHGDVDDDEGEAAPAPFEGTEKPFGRVRIELVTAPSLSERVQRAKAAREGDAATLEPQRTQRRDLEGLFSREVDGEAAELDEALETVADEVWQQLEGDGRAIYMRTARNRLPAKTKPPFPRDATAQPDRPADVAQLRLNPEPYKHSPPDFARLARLYPSTLGNYVTIHSSGRGSTSEYASLDFQDASAVRCLAETLLYHDFGIVVDLHNQRLCPMIPNRLNYITYLRKVLASSLPVLHSLEASRTTRLSSHRKRPRSVEPEAHNKPIRGLDIGTGASAIYPLLGCAVEPDWSFVATDIDAESIKHAKKTIEDPANNRTARVPASSASTGADSGGIVVNHRLRDRVQLLQRRVEDALIPLDAEVGCGDLGPRFHFSMCNPPFYQSQEDMQSSADAKERKPNAVSLRPAARPLSARDTAAETDPGSPHRTTQPLSGGATGLPRHVWRDDHFGRRSGVCDADGRREPAAHQPRSRGLVHLDAGKVVERLQGRRDHQECWSKLPWRILPCPLLYSPRKSSPCRRELTTMLGARVEQIDSWAVTKLVQGQTGRWVVSWTLTGLRLPNVSVTAPSWMSGRDAPSERLHNVISPWLCRTAKYLSRLPTSHPCTHVPSTVLTTLLPPQPFATFDDVLSAVQSVFATLDDCEVSATHDAEACEARGLDVIAWRASWTRAARREKARRMAQTAEGIARETAKVDGDGEGVGDPEVCTRFTVRRREAAWKLEAVWTWGRRKGAFEGLAGHVFRKVADGAKAVE
ncbi:hypothetical protein ACQY0O_006156 [Thecaphora frezii]